MLVLGLRDLKVRADAELMLVTTQSPAMEELRAKSEAFFLDDAQCEPVSDIAGERVCFLWDPPVAKLATECVEALMVTSNQRSCRVDNANDKLINDWIEKSSIILLSECEKVGRLERPRRLCCKAGRCIHRGFGRVQDVMRRKFESHLKAMQKESASPHLWTKSCVAVRICFEDALPLRPPGAPAPEGSVLGGDAVAPPKAARHQWYHLAYINQKPWEPMFWRLQEHPPYQLNRGSETSNQLGIND